MPHRRRELIALLVVACIGAGVAVADADAAPVVSPARAGLEVPWDPSATAGPAAFAALQSPRLVIGGRTYWYGNVGSLASWLAPTQGIKLVLKLVNRCQGVRAFVFLSTSAQSRGVGIVAWLANDPRSCLGVTGGGPGGGVSGSVCSQAVRTPAQQDPGNVAGLVGQPPSRYFVYIGATSRQVCADLATEVPGGVWGRTIAPITGLASNSVILIKCQLIDGQGLIDYVAPQTRLPSSKSTFWIYDAYVYTGITERLGGVPSCWN